MGSRAELVREVGRKPPHSLSLKGLQRRSLTSLNSPQNLLSQLQEDTKLNPIARVSTLCTVLAKATWFTAVGVKRIIAALVGRVITQPDNASGTPTLNTVDRVGSRRWYNHCNTMITVRGSETGLLKGARVRARARRPWHGTARLGALAQTAVFGWGGLDRLLILRGRNHKGGRRRRAQKRTHRAWQVKPKMLGQHILHTSQSTKIGYQTWVHVDQIGSRLIAEAERMIRVV